MQPPVRVSDLVIDDGLEGGGLHGRKEGLAADAQDADGGHRHGVEIGRVLGVRQGLVAQAVPGAHLQLEAFRT